MEKEEKWSAAHFRYISKVHVAGLDLRIDITHTHAGSIDHFVKFEWHITQRSQHTMSWYR